NASLRRRVPSALDQLDLVAVRILNERDHRVAAFDGPGFTRDGAAFGTHRIACGSGVVDLDGDVTERAAEVVAIHAVVVRELEHGRVGFVAVADERQRVLLLGPVGRAQYAHAQHIGVEARRALKIAYAQHGVEYSHSAIRYRLSAMASDRDQN